MEVMRQEARVRLPSIKELTIGLPSEQPAIIPTSGVPPPVDPNYSYQQQPTRHSSLTNPSLSPQTIHNSLPLPLIPPLEPQAQPPVLLPPTSVQPSSRNSSLSAPGTSQTPHLQMGLQLPMANLEHSQHPQTYTLPPNPNPVQHATIVPKKKRPRRKANEMVRLYACNYKSCRNSYGTLNHLNAHITFKRHGPKRKPEEFKQIRELYKLKKKLSDTANSASKVSQELEIRQLQAKINADALKKSLESGDLEEKIQSQENIKLLGSLTGALIDKSGHDSKIPVFHQQRGYNGYGRYDHTLTTNDLEKLPIND